MPSYRSISNIDLLKFAQDFKSVAKISAGFCLSDFVFDATSDLQVEFVVLKRFRVVLKVEIRIAQLARGGIFNF